MTPQRILFRTVVRLFETINRIQGPVKQCHIDLAPLPSDNNHTDIITIAFNNDKIIPLHTRYVATNYTAPHTHIIADNSTDPRASANIEAFCQENNIAYLRLPTNKLGKIGGPSYSHATALNWCYHHIINRRKPAYFGFTDHDLFPLKPVDLRPILDRQNFYGPKRPRGNYWYLSGILSFFKYSYTRTRKVDFMPVTFHGVYLDSGGGNWNGLYREAEPSKLVFCKERLEKASDKCSDLPGFVGGTADNTKEANRHQDLVEIFDELWLHTINGSYWKKIAITKEDTLPLLIERYAATI